MIKRTLGLLWAADALILSGIVAVSIQIVSPSEGLDLDSGVIPPVALPPFQLREEAWASTLLRDLPNPLGPLKGDGSGAASRISEIASLLGFDGIAGDPNSGTAYLLLTARKLGINAYLGETIRDLETGLEIPELAGWKLARLTPTGAVFSNGAREELLTLEDGPVAASGARRPIPKPTAPEPPPPRKDRRLGISGGPLTDEEEIRRLKMQPSQGAIVVQEVVPGSVAERAGILVGDYVGKFNNAALSRDTPREQLLEKMATEVRPYAIYPVGVVRNGMWITLNATWDE